MSKALTAIDTYLRKNRRRGQLENIGKLKKTFLSYCGDITFITYKNLNRTDSNQGRKVKIFML